MKIFNTCIFLMSLLVFITSLSAQDVRLVDLSGFYAEEIQIAGFTLDSDQTISIEAATISPRRNYREFHFAYAWILNSDSREIVWELTEADLEDRVRYKATYTDEKDLAAGTYEVYYSTYPHFNFNDDAYFHWGARGFFSGIFNALFDDEVDNDQYKFFEDLYDELYFYVEGIGRSGYVWKRYEEQLFGRFECGNGNTRLWILRMFLGVVFLKGKLGVMLKSI